MYHDGVMPPELEKRFEAHLASCQTCMQVLLDLQNDLSAMGSMHLHRMPEKLLQNEPIEAKVQSAGGKNAGHREKCAVFTFLPDMLNMITAHFGTGAFESIPEPAVRGKETGRFAATVMGVHVSLYYEAENRFSVEFQKIRGRSVSIERNGRLLDKRMNVKKDNFVIENLEHGTYSISIDETRAMTFTVH
jgi:hypothetical protein